MSDSIPIVGDLTEEQQRGIKKALDKRERADYDCYMILKRLVGDYRILSLLRDVRSLFDTEDDYLSFKDEIHEAIERREKANDEFLSFISGRS